MFKNRVKLHQEILNGFQVTERTRLECKFCYFPFQRAITPKICNPELWFLCSARCLMLINNPVKFHYYIPKKLSRSLCIAENIECFSSLECYPWKLLSYCTGPRNVLSYCKKKKKKKKSERVFKTALSG